MINSNNTIYLRRDIIEMILEFGKETKKSDEEIFNTLAETYEVSVEDIKSILNMTYEERIEDLSKQNYDLELITKTYDNVMKEEDINKIYQRIKEKMILKV